jgi:hypothetical protein
MKTRAALLLIAFITALSGCQGSSRTFAGFTYGGGGHTYSAEPALLTAGPEQSVLECGGPQDPNSVRLTWQTSQELGKELPLTGGEFKVQEKGDSTLTSGLLVVQSKKGNIVHGSFDLESKTEDGRTLKVVGSFSAEQKT